MSTVDMDPPSQVNRCPKYAPTLPLCGLALEQTTQAWAAHIGS